MILSNPSALYANTCLCFKIILKKPTRGSRIKEKRKLKEKKKTNKRNERKKKKKKGGKGKRK